MNTALGNCLIMSMLVKAWADTCGVYCKLINNGDDCVVFMERSDLARFSDGLDAWFLARGFEMKVEEAVSEFEAIEFCQMHPVKADGWVMVRNLHSALTKDVMALGCTTLHEYACWLHAVGTCGWSLYGDMPIFSALYEAMMRNGVASNMKFASLMENSGMIRLGKRPRIRLGDEVAIRPRTRLSFQRAFGPTVMQQIEVEQYLHAWNGMTDILPAVGKVVGLSCLSFGK